MARDKQSRKVAELGPNRRHYLKLLGAGGMLSIAGCTAGDGDSDGEGSTPTATATEGDMETETTPTEAMGSDRYGGHIRVGSASEPQDMHPMFGLFAGKTTMELMYSRLTQLNSNTEVIPALAKDWEHAGDARAWTFNLREGVVFPNTDGTEMTAEDVMASARAIQDEDKVSQDAASHIGDVESMEVADDYVFKITLKEPDLFYPKRIAEVGNLWNILPKDVVENRFEEASETDFGTGPFNMVERAADDFIRFERNPHHFRTDENGNELPYLDEYTWKLIPDSLARVSAIEDQRVDGLLSLPFTQLSRIATADQINVQEITTPGFAMAVLNVELEAEDGSNPFANVKVRKAMKHAMSRKQMQTAVDKTATIGHYDPVPPTFEFYNPFPKGLEFGTESQPEEAQRLLEEAGYSDGFTLKQDFVYTESDQRFATWAVLFQEQMKKVGIDFDIQLVTSDTWISKHWNNPDSFFYSSWADRLVDPTVHKLAGRSDAKWNSSNWSHEEYDAQWDKAMGATDRETFKEAFYEMQRIFHLDGPWLIWGFTREFIPYQDTLQGVNMLPSASKKPYANAWFADDSSG